MVRKKSMGDMDEFEKEEAREKRRKKLEKEAARRKAEFGTPEEEDLIAAKFEAKQRAAAKERAKDRAPFLLGFTTELGPKISTLKVRPTDSVAKIREAIEAQMRRKNAKMFDMYAADGEGFVLYHNGRPIVGKYERFTARDLGWTANATVKIRPKSWLLEEVKRKRKKHAREKLKKEFKT